MTDAVTHHAEHRCNQSADEIERRKDRQQQDRSGLDQDIPAEDERLHLESPRGEQIGGPLETVIPDTEGSERGRPRGPAQNLMPRFIAFHPALFLILRKADFRRGNLFRAKRYSLAVPYVNYAPEFAMDPMDPRDQHAVIGVRCCGRPRLLELG